MRKTININSNWLFKKTRETPQNSFEGFEEVNLPHTWNGKDGQDGGSDYYRGDGLYYKKLFKSELVEAERYYLEFNGTNSSASIFFNGKKVYSHDGGYSTYRVDITDELLEENEIVVICNNADNNRVYPQNADFTFYGGIYRDVNIIAVSKTHFDLDYFGGKGIKVTPIVKGDNAEVNVELFTNQALDGASLKIELVDADNNLVDSKEVKLDENKKAFDLLIKNVHLWNGRKDPYLYKAKASIVLNNEVIDNVEANFGCRFFEIDPNKGFFLNGKSYPLRGVSRHQDRPLIGNALLKEHHEEDMALILEMGATTIRLAHYQHDQYFYDLCDKYGLIIWAEIPYISSHMDTGYDNTISQMKELIVQNYNHPCIVVWGLSNEITLTPYSKEKLLKNHIDLNNLCHQMDKTRKTTMALLSMCDVDNPYIIIPDVVSWNLYFGWYGGNTSANGPFLDEFHQKYPTLPVGMSEYGCEALNWHTSKPHQGDYSEEYQAYYHEELIKQLYTRDYIWATHVWNMFDFAADSRNEGGEAGMNHKGLVTFDRKYKKDSFYAYKAWLSDDPFIHICGKRYVDRCEDVSKVTVYSNLPEIELFVNGVSVGKQKAEDHFFHFEVTITEETNIKAVYKEYSDENLIRKVATPNESYILKDTGTILNWFDITEKEGYLSLNDTINDLKATFKGRLLYTMVLMSLAFHKKDKSKVVKTPANAKKKSKGASKMSEGFTMIRMAGFLGFMGITITKEELLKFNAKLNKIKKINRDLKKD